MVCTLEHKKADNDQQLADPPRPDFQVRTEARRRNFNPDALPEDQLSQRTASAVVAYLDYGAALRAAVRAKERADGATLAGDAASGERQYAEHEKELSRLPALSQAVLDESDRLGSVWERFSSEQGLPGLSERDAQSALDRGQGRVSLLDAAGPDGRALIKASRISYRPRVLELDGYRDDVDIGDMQHPGVELRDALNEVAKATTAVANVLREPHPNSESDQDPH